MTTGFAVASRTEETNDSGHTLASILSRAQELGASDIHLSSAAVPFYRVGGVLAPDDTWRPLSETELEGFAKALLPNVAFDKLNRVGSADGAHSFDVTTRFRFNVYRSDGKLCIALRKLESRFHELSELGLNDRLYDVCAMQNGLILVAGPTGSGKSTTLATLLHRINETRQGHIITIEDPIEYVHTSLQSLVTQRQIGLDTPGFSQALVDAVRQDPDVILVGELRDLETIRTAISAAETGHLVLASVHAGDCMGAIERLTSVFPGNELALVHHLLSTTLRTVIAQHLVVRCSSASDKERASDPRMCSNRVLASEVLHVNSAIANLISNANLVQIRSILETSSADGMYTLDHCLGRLWRQKLISEGSARALARNPKLMFEMGRSV